VQQFEAFGEQSVEIQFLCWAEKGRWVINEPTQQGNTRSC
jgi:hypothetical protein